MAGDVPNAGIYSLDGPSTTLGALLKRAGHRNGGNAKYVRIVRSVEVSPTPDTRAREFYCQQVEIIPGTSRGSETPVFGQEVVIVDSIGVRPVYVAVMPHFILQLPLHPGRSISLEQVLEELRVHWPSVRNPEVGAARIDRWGRAARVGGPHQHATATPLRAGDIVCVDGTSLDPAQVLPAATALANLAGAAVSTEQTAR
jgi:hypothetical protein